MGYTTEFTGRIHIEPPLNEDEYKYLQLFSSTRRMKCEQSPYYVAREGFMGQDNGPDVLDYNEPPQGQPGLWCQWVPTEDKAGLEWNGVEKFYFAMEWMQYLVEHFL